MSSSIRWVVYAAAVLIIAIPIKSAALEINLSRVNGSNAGPIDPIKFDEVMRRAADYWSEVIVDRVTVNVSYGWDSLGAMNSQRPIPTQIQSTSMTRRPTGTPRV